MAMKLGYDELAIVASYLRDKDRMSLCLVDKRSYALNYPALLRANHARSLKVPAHYQSPRQFAIAYAISRHDHEFLARILDAVGHVLAGGSEVYKPGYDNYQSLCLIHRDPVALQMARVASPGIDAVLAQILGPTYDADFKSGMVQRKQEFVEIWVDAGWVNDFDKYKVASILSMIRSGKALRALVKAGIDPIMDDVYYLLDQVTPLHYWGAKGEMDDDLLKVLLEHGQDIDGLQSLARDGVDVNDSVDYEKSRLKPRAWHTPLDLAAQQRNTKTMKKLIALGASLGGSSEVVDRGDGPGEKSDGHTPTTTPLHELFREIETNLFSDTDEYGLSTTSRVRFTGRVGDPFQEEEDGPQCPNDSKRHLYWEHRGDVLQNLYVLAKLVLRGTRCLLGTGRYTYLDRDIPGIGTPLTRFLTLVQNCRKCHALVVANKDVPECEKDQRPTCAQVEYFSDEIHTLRPLGEVCDLLIDAGVRVPFENYEEKAGVVGVSRLMRLLAKHELEIANRFIFGLDELFAISETTSESENTEITSESENSEGTTQVSDASRSTQTD